MRLFFYAFFRNNALAQKPIPLEKINWKTLDPLEKIGQNSVKQKETHLKKCSEYSNLNQTEKKIKLKEERYASLVGESPIKTMIPAIAHQDKNVSAFLISIAKKESDWGVYSPHKYGKDCYNYWGYRGSYKPTISGYSCFDTPEQAVATVGGRIKKLISKKINTPKRMVVWKCGSSCANFPANNVQKWISDVSLYYNQLNS